MAGRLGSLSVPLLAALLAVVLAASAQAATAARWVGTFDQFPASAWADRWGLAAEGAWGFDNDMAATGGTLDVTYRAGSSARSCTNCPATGGGEFYTLFAQLGHPDWTTAPVLDLKYSLKFPAGFDFGHGGKLPGLFGGKIGEESGGNHGQGWSTRYMWRTSGGAAKGEVYFYSPTGSGFGKDLGLGKWKFAADARWHSVEQQVNRQKQTVTIWYDGRQVFTTKVTGISGIAFSGVFFSTFFGGHDTSWGPKRTVHAYFADFSVSTAPQH